VAEIVQEISSSEYAIDDNLSRFVWMPQYVEGVIRDFGDKYKINFE